MGEGQCLGFTWGIARSFRSCIIEARVNEQQVNGMSIVRILGVGGLGGLLAAILSIPAFAQAPPLNEEIDVSDCIFSVASVDQAGHEWDVPDPSVRVSTAHQSIAAHDLPQAPDSYG